MTGAKKVYAGTLRGLARGAGSLFGPAPLTLADGSAVLRLDATNAVAGTDLPELVFSRAAPMIWNRGVAGGTTWAASRLTREGRALLVFAGGTAAAGALTANDGFKVVTPPGTDNGMAAPYYVEATGDFLAYDETGLGLPAVFGYAGGDINTNPATAIYNPTAAQTLTDHRELYALKTGFGVSGAYDLMLGSGGLIINAGMPAIDCNLQFSNREGVVWNTVAAAINGAIGGTDGLTKGGGGTLTLGAVNAYSGPTTIHGGQVTLGVAGALPAGQPVAVHAGTLELNGQSTAFGDLSMAGGQILNSGAAASTLMLGANVRYDGGYNTASIWPLAARTLNVTLSGPTTFTVANGYSEPDLRIGDAASTRYATLSGTDAPITKKGPGFLQFTGSNSFTGDITIEEGILHGTVHAADFHPFGNTNNNVYLNSVCILSFGGGGTGYGTALGDIEFSGANGVRVSVGTSTIGVTVDSLTRKAGTRATLLMMGSYTSASYYDFWGYGTSRRFNVLAWKLPNPAPNTNRMLGAWCVLTRRESDLTAGAFAYADTASGEIKALAGVGANAYQHHRGTLAGAAGNEVIDLAAAEGLAADLEVYALRTSQDIAVSGGDPTLTLGSGGLIANADLTVAPKVKFGSTGAGQALVYVGGYLGYVKTATLDPSPQASD